MSRVVQRSTKLPIKFYHTFEKEIEEHTPFIKLVCIKGVVGVCTYQAFGAPYLAEWIGFEGDNLTDVLIAVEMGLIFCFLFAKGYAKGERKKAKEE